MPEATMSVCVPSEGSLRELSMPALIHGLRKDRHDGVLVVEHGKKKKAVEFAGGWPVAVKSNLRSDCLGNYLEREGLVDVGRLDESVERMRAGEGRQGEILIEMKALEEATLGHALQAHALEKFLELFAWRDGRFAVRARAHVERGSALDVGDHPTHLVLEGVRRRFPLRRVDRFLSANARFVLRPREDGQRFDEVGASSEEEAWLEGIDGSVTLGSISKEPEWVRRLVYGLVSMELLELGEPHAGEAADSEDTASSGSVEEVRERPLPLLEDESAGRPVEGRILGGEEAPNETEGQRALAAETEFQRGHLLLADRDYEGALLHFGRAMEHFPSAGEYRSYYGWTLYLRHPDDELMLGEALEHCREGVKLAKGREKPYLLLGRLYRATGKTVAAKKMFARAVQIEPQCVEAMRELRIMNMRDGKGAARGKGVLKKLLGR